MPISTANEPSTSQPRWKPRPKPPVYPGDATPLPPDPRFLKTIDPVMQAALDPLDRTAAAMESLWGVSRLESLVSPETAARFASARRKLNQAIRAKDPNLAASRASVLQRGWITLDAEARALGHAPDAIDVWCVPHAPTAKWYAICRHAKDVDKARQLHPDHTVIALTDLVASHLVTFRAQMLATDPLPDDEIPW